jgi:hypothetical protein
MAEMAMLEHQLAEARSGRGGLVLLAGEPGVGKTRSASGQYRLMSWAWPPLPLWLSLRAVVREQG